MTKEKFKKEPCGLTWEQLGEQIEKIVTETTKGNVAAIRRAAQLEPTEDGKIALKTVANILEKQND